MQTMRRVMTIALIGLGFLSICCATNTSARVPTSRPTNDAEKEHATVAVTNAEVYGARPFSPKTYELKRATPGYRWGRVDFTAKAGSSGLSVNLTFIEPTEVEKYMLILPSLRDLSLIDEILPSPPDFD